MERYARRAAINTLKRSGDRSESRDVWRCYRNGEACGGNVHENDVPPVGGGGGYCGLTRNGTHLDMKMFVCCLRFPGVRKVPSYAYEMICMLDFLEADIVLECHHRSVRSVS